MAGWRTRRKIVVVESDDWGSIRIRSKADYESMLRAGLGVDRSNFTRYDSLESNADLENLFEILARHKDSEGRSAVFTPMSIMANPDFERIEQSSFKRYYYEPFMDTYRRYPKHDRVPGLWNTGIKNRLFIPALHGREHINTARWMRALQAKNEGLRLAFDHRSLGISWYKDNRLPEYLAAFDPETPTDIQDYEGIIRSAAKIFNEAYGYKPEYFIASNSPEPKSLEKTLKEAGVNYLMRYKLQKYPLGNEVYQWEFNWLGKKNNEDQMVLTRNCGFEPSDPTIKDWVNSCMNEIEIAFKWRKPAVISSHRVNYIGYIDPANAHYGLNELDRLLSGILMKWHNVEFLNSIELGNVIRSS
jgi:hypothetical protein